MNTQAVSEWGAEIERRRAKLVDRVGLATIASGLVAVISLYVRLPENMSALERLAEMMPFMAGWLVIAIAWAWRGIRHRTRALTLLLLAYILGIIISARGGLPGSGRVWLLREGGSFLLVAVILTLILWSFDRSWIEALRSVSRANKQMQAKTRELEEANKRLHRQTSQLQATAEVVRAGSSILEPEALLAEVVNRIQEGLSAMDVYYVGLYLLDEAQQSAVLRAATGEAGQLLLEMGHKLAPDETSAIGWCITYRQACIASDTGENTVLFDALPRVQLGYTRSEIALPLRSRGRILGALNVQSTQEAAFSEADIAVLQMMADQVSVAIDNAQLFSQTAAVLEDAQAVQRHSRPRTWKEFLGTRPVTQVDYTQPGTEPGDESFLREARRAVTMHEQTVATNGSAPDPDGKAPSSQAALVVPLKLRGQVIGTMALHETRHQRAWTAEDIALTETVAEQVALTAETLRLMDGTQRRAAREQVRHEVTDRMRRAVNMDALMRTTIQNVITALGASSAFVHLSTPPASADAEGDDGTSGEGDD